MAEKQGKPLPDLMAHMAKMHAMKRVGQPEEIAAPIVFLASNAGAPATCKAAEARHSPCLVQAVGALADECAVNEGSSTSLAICHGLQLPVAA